MIDRDTFVNVIINEHPLTSGEWSEETPDGHVVCPMMRVMQERTQYTHEQLEALATGAIGDGPDEFPESEVRRWCPEYVPSNSSLGAFSAVVGGVMGCDRSLVSRFIHLYDDWVEEWEDEQTQAYEEFGQTWNPDPEAPKSTEPYREWERLLEARRRVAIEVWDKVFGQQEAQSGAEEVKS